MVDGAGEAVVDEHAHADEIKIALQSAVHLSPEEVVALARMIDCIVWL